MCIQFLFHSAAGIDYAPVAQPLSIRFKHCVNLTVFDDIILEDTEDFAVVLSTTDDAVVITRNLTAVFIPNADSMCIYILL